MTGIPNSTLAELISQKVKATLIKCENLLTIANAPITQKAIVHKAAFDKPNNVIASSCEEEK